MKFNVFPFGKESISSWLQYVCRRVVLFLDLSRDVETQENDGSEKAQKKQLDRNSREWWISGWKTVGKLKCRD